MTGAAPSRSKEEGFRFSARATSIQEEEEGEEEEQTETDDPTTPLLGSHQHRIHRRVERKASITDMMEAASAAKAAKGKRLSIALPSSSTEFPRRRNMGKFGSTQRSSALSCRERMTLLAKQQEIYVCEVFINRQISKRSMKRPDLFAYISQAVHQFTKHTSHDNMT
jgi:hypothetical protein